MNIIYAFSQISDHVQGSEFKVAKDTCIEKLCSAAPNKHSNSAKNAIFEPHCSNSVFSYMCYRFTRALKGIKQIDDHTGSVRIESKNSASHSAVCYKQEASMTALVLRLLAAGGRQHPILRHWIWSVAASLPEGPDCVAIALSVVHSHEILLLTAWAHLASCIDVRKTVDENKVKKATCASVTDVEKTCILCLLVEIDRSNQSSALVFSPFLSHDSAEHFIHSFDNNANSALSQQTAGFSSINSLEESLFSSIDSASALVELPPQLAFYALLRSLYQRHLFVNFVLCNDAKASLFTTRKCEGNAREGTINFASESACAHDVYGLLPRSTYAWLIPFWNTQHSPWAVLSSFCRTEHSTDKLLCLPPSDGGLSWLCNSTALPSHYESLLHKRFTRYLCATSPQLSEMVVLEKWQGTISSSMLPESHTASSEESNGFESETYIQLRSSKSYEGALGLFAVMLAEHLQQTSMALLQCYHYQCNSVACEFHQKLQEPAEDLISSTKNSHPTTETSNESANHNSYTFGDHFTSLEYALARMQLDEELFGSPFEEHSIKSSPGHSHCSESMHICKASWTALVATLAIGEGIPAQFVRMCLEPIDKSLRVHPQDPNILFPFTSPPKSCDLIEGSPGWKSNLFPLHLPTPGATPDITGIHPTPELKSKESTMSSAPTNSLLSGDTKVNHRILAYHDIFPRPLFHLRGEDVALYAPAPKIMASFDMKRTMDHKREKRPRAEKVCNPSEPLSQTLYPDSDALLKYSSTECLMGCVSSSMATVAALALRHPRAEMFQLECIWQLIYYHHCTARTQPRGKTFDKDFLPCEDNAAAGRFPRALEKAVSDSAHRREQEKKLQQDLARNHSQRREEAGSTSLEAKQRERVEELECRIQRIFDNFVYSALVGVSPCIKWVQKNTNEEPLLEEIELREFGNTQQVLNCLDQVSEDEGSTIPTSINAHMDQPRMSRFSLPVSTEKLNIIPSTESSRRVLKLGSREKESKTSSTILCAAKDSTSKTRVPHVSNQGVCPNIIPSTATRERSTHSFKNEQQRVFDEQEMLPLISKLSTSLEFTSISLCLQNIFNILLKCVEKLCFDLTNDRKDSTFLPKDSQNLSRNYLSCSSISASTLKLHKLNERSFLPSPSTKEYPHSSEGLYSAKYIEFSTETHEGSKLLSLTTPEYVKQFQQFLSTSFRSRVVNPIDPISHTTSLFCNTNSSYFESASLVTQSAIKATVGTILCFCIYRFLLHCYLQASFGSEYRAALSFSIDARLSENTNTTTDSLSVSLQNEKANETCGLTMGAEKVFLTRSYHFLQKKMCLILRHTILILRPILQAYAESFSLPKAGEDKSDIRLDSYLSNGTLRKKDKKKNPMFYGPVSCILLPKVLGAYEAALKPLNQNTEGSTARELSELKKMFKEYGLIL